MLLDIDECASSPCQYGGICEDAVNSYTCSCLMGSAGTNCENGKFVNRYYSSNIKLNFKIIHL